MKLLILVLLLFSTTCLASPIIESLKLPTTNDNNPDRHLMIAFGFVKKQSLDQNYYDFLHRDKVFIKSIVPLGMRLV